MQNDNCFLEFATIEHALMSSWHKFTDIGYNMNKRCDQFIKNHIGKHILFLGDSFAQGDGLEKEETWCYKTYLKLSNLQETSGYFNLGISGGSNFESIDSFFKYCSLYGNPDVVFFIITEFGRDHHMVQISNFMNMGNNNSTHTISNFTKHIYTYLEKYCEKNNIQLYSFSWIKELGTALKTPERYLFKNLNGKEMIRPLWTEQSLDNIKDYYDSELLKNFSTFYDYTKEEILQSVFKYDLISKNKQKSLWASDLVHPGTSFHDFYSDFIFSKYLEKNDNTRD